MRLNIRKELFVKHPYVLMFLTMMSLVIVICSWIYTEHFDEHDRMNLCTEDKLQCTTLSNILQEEIMKTYAEVKNRNDLFVTDYLNNHVPVKDFFLDRVADRKPAAKLVGSQRCVTKADQMQSMGMVLFGANNEDVHPSIGFLRNGVLLQNGRLIVPLTGTYLVYSSFHHRLQYSLPGGQASADVTPVLKHAIYLFNIQLGHDQEKASTSNDHIDCNCLPFVHFQTEISTLVDLRAGDEISVKLNDCSYIMHSKANYFGLRLI